MWAMKPTPQASCSFAGSYSPCLGGTAKWFTVAPRLARRRRGAVGKPRHLPRGNWGIYLPFLGASSVYRSASKVRRKPLAGGPVCASQGRLAPPAVHAGDQGEPGG